MACADANERRGDLEANGAAGAASGAFHCKPPLSDCPRLFMRALLTALWQQRASPYAEWEEAEYQALDENKERAN
jgi:hypothetical protein